MTQLEVRYLWKAVINLIAPRDDEEQIRDEIKFLEYNGVEIDRVETSNTIELTAYLTIQQKDLYDSKFSVSDAQRSMMMNPMSFSYSLQPAQTFIFDSIYRNGEGRPFGEASAVDSPDDTPF